MRKWSPRFQWWTYSMLFGTTEFVDDCRMLGFEMDRKDALAEITIAECEDVELLGSGLFSGWRHYSHWSDFKELGPEERAWFGAVLRRLTELST